MLAGDPEELVVAGILMGWHGRLPRPIGDCFDDFLLRRIAEAIDECRSSGTDPTPKTIAAMTQIAALVLYDIALKGADVLGLYADDLARELERRRQRRHVQLAALRFRQIAREPDRMFDDSYADLVRGGVFQLRVIVGGARG